MKSKILRRIVEQYFSFSRTERNGLVVLCAILCVVIAANFLINLFDKPEPNDFYEIKKAIAEWKSRNETVMESRNKILFPFNPNTVSETKLDCLAIPGFVKQNILKYRQSGGRFYGPASIKKIYGMNDSIFGAVEEYLLFDRQKKAESINDLSEKTNDKPVVSFFDPNFTSEEELIKLGFNNYQASNLVKYRAKGGIIKKPGDLLKIYGIDTAFYMKLAPWIKIEAREADHFSSSPETFRIIELNTADSTALIRLNGIGPVFASRIIRYRELLGGFIKKEQLLEVYNFRSETFRQIEDKISADSVKVKKLSLNFSGFSDLARHPYLKAEVVNKIIECRNNNGPFETCEELLSKNLMNEELYLKVRPYLKLN